VSVSKKPMAKLPVALMKSVPKGSVSLKGSAQSDTR
jgi:hypothetical protein